jgi:hypothetical protein
MANIEGHPADLLNLNPKRAAEMTSEALRDASTEFARRASLLGKPGQVSRAHKAALKALASR